jgi:threonine efflux protein
MIVRSSKRTNIVGSPPDGTRQMSCRRAYAIGIATGLRDPRSRLRVFAVALPAQPSLGIAAAAVATMVAVSISWYFLVAKIFITEPMVGGYRRIGHWIDRSPVAMGLDSPFDIARPAGRQTGIGEQIA